MPVQSERVTQEQPAAPKKLCERSGAKLSEPFGGSLMRERAQLLGHREAPLSQPTLRRLDLQMQGV